MASFLPIFINEKRWLFMTTDILTLIPARMKATRLPGKPLAEIAGKPMICYVWEKAMKADLGPVFVATDSPEIIAAIEGIGGRVSSQ